MDWNEYDRKVDNSHAHMREMMAKVMAEVAEEDPEMAKYLEKKQAHLCSQEHADKVKTDARRCVEAREELKRLGIY